MNEELLIMGFMEETHLLAKLMKLNTEEEEKGFSVFRSFRSPTSCHGKVCQTEGVEELGGSDCVVKKRKDVNYV